MSLVRHSLAVIAVAATSGCLAPATQVHVYLETDAPRSQLLELSATIAGAAATPPVWSQGPGRPALPTPTFFAVTPGGAARDSRVTLVVRATLRTSEAPRTEITFRRTATFSFQPHRTGSVRIFIATTCFAPATGCTTPGSCTVAQRCDEQGLTCGDEGRCVPREVVVSLEGIDARPPTDATMDRNIDSARDSAPDSLPDSMRDSMPDAPARCPGATDCGGVCVNTNDDARHCGVCGRACPAGQACIGAMCTACVAPRLMCGAECVNPDNNTQHCGGCGRACPARPNADSRCGGGRCSISCVAPFANCDGDDSNGCEINTSNDPSQCGRCGQRCGADRMCSGGSCVCTPGRSDCGGTCLPTGASCTVGTGACMRTGTIVCTGSGTTGCSASAGSPMGEDCNGVDDNCDGTVDEDPVCVQCLAIPQINVWPLTHTRGDREFNGHGPDLSLGVDYTISGNQVTATGCVTAVETVSDFTTGTGCQSALSEAASSPIDAILDPPYRFRYVDTNHNCEGVPAGAVVSGGTCVGDTSGDDICGSPDTCGSPDCTGCIVNFSCIRVRRRAM